MTSDPELRGRVERDPVFLSGVRNVTDEEEGELHPLTNLHRDSPSTNSTKLDRASRLHGKPRPFLSVPPAP